MDDEKLALTLETAKAIKPICVMQRYFVEEFGAYVYLQKLSGLGTIEYEAFVATTEHANMDATEKSLHYIAKLLSMCVVDANGKPLFTPAFFLACESGFVLRLHKQVRAVTGLDVDTETLEKN